MSIWKRIAAAPTGVLPDGLVTKVAIVAGAGVLAAIVLTTSLTGPASGPETVIEVPEAANATLQQRVEQAIAAEARRAAAAEEIAQRAAAAELDAQGRAGTIPTLPQTPVLTAGIVGLDPGAAAADAVTVGLTAAQTEAEIVLRETLRLEAIERQTRSLRTEPLVLTYRDMAGTAAVSAASPAAAAPPLPLLPPPAEGGAGTLANSIQAAGDFRVHAGPARRGGGGGGEAAGIGLARRGPGHTERCGGGDCAGGSSRAGRHRAGHSGRARCSRRLGPDYRRVIPRSGFW